MTLNNIYVRTFAAGDLLERAAAARVWDKLTFDRRNKSTRAGEASWTVTDAHHRLRPGAVVDGRSGRGRRALDRPARSRTHWEQLYLPVLAPHRGRGRPDADRAGALHHLLRARHQRRLDARRQGCVRARDAAASRSTWRRASCPSCTGATHDYLCRSAARGKCRGHRKPADGGAQGHVRAHRRRERAHLHRQRQCAARKQQDSDACEESAGSRAGAHAGKPIGVAVRTALELAEVLAANPFPDAPADRTVVIFLDAAPPKSALSRHQGRGPRGGAARQA